MERVLKFKYSGCRISDRSTNKVECENKAMNGRRDTGAIKALMNRKDLGLVCEDDETRRDSVEHDSDVRKRVIWKEKKKSSPDG